MPARLSDPFETASRSRPSARDRRAPETIRRHRRTLATVLSLLPPLALVLMPVRMATGVASGWQVALAIALTVVGSGVLTWLAGRIYSNSVLRLGGRVRLVDALFGK